MLFHTEDIYKELLTCLLL